MRTTLSIKLMAALLAIAVVALLAGCAAEPTATPVPTAAADLEPIAEPSADPLLITVSIVPQKYFVERIGGDLVSVNVMVEPGASPATYEPKPAQLTALAGSAAYFSIGVAFENAWLDRIAAANPEMQMVDTTEDIKRLPLADHSHEGEDEHEDDDKADGEVHDDADADHDDEHGEEALDPHVWLSPSLAAVQARQIAIALGDLDPDHKDTFIDNLNTFLADIESLDADIRQTLAGVEGRTFMVFHPSWGYFAADYGLEQIAVEIGGQEPSAKELAALIEEAEHEGIKVVFAQPEFSTRAAETIAQEIGGEVLLISPLAHDWMTNMRHVADAFAGALRED